MSEGAPRKPRAVKPDDPRLTESAPEASPTLSGLPLGEVDPDASPPARIPTEPILRTGLRWGTIFVGGLVSLTLLAFGVRLWDWTLGLVVRQDWIGWTAIGLAGLTGLAGLILLGREIFGLFRVARLRGYREDAATALEQSDKDLAKRTLSRIKFLYGDRPELRWPLARLKQHEGDVLSPSELLALIDREVMASVDDLARATIAISARRTSVVTAMSPTVVIDVLYVLFENLRMIRRIAGAYGGRPGLAGSLRLANLVTQHIIATGGLELTDDLFPQFIGQSVLARLSGRLGQGALNGALTARVGVAAVHVVRPMPFIEAKPPRFRELAAEAAKGLRGGTGAAEKPRA